VFSSSSALGCSAFDLLKKIQFPFFGWPFSASCLGRRWVANVGKGVSHVKLHRSGSRLFEGFFNFCFEWFVKEKPERMLEKAEKHLKMS
jgi:hypothetical protein